MSGYEDLVELGIEGVDFVTDKYHDAVYDRVPAIPRFKRFKRKKEKELKEESRHPDKGYPRADSVYSEEEFTYEDDIEMYAPDRRRERSHDRDYQDRDYQDRSYQDRSYQDRDYQDEGNEQERYYGGERSYIYKGPAAGALVPRNQNQGGDIYDPRSNQDYDDRGYDQPRGRPGPQRRGSSWSPPRSRKHHDSRKKERGGSRDKGTERRLVAGIGGAIVGGYAGYALSKKSKDPDRLGGQVGTVATVVGAIAGALGGREAAEFWDHHQHKDDNKEENWEEKWGKGENTGHNRPQYRNQ